MKQSLKRSSTFAIEPDKNSEMMFQKSQNLLIRVQNKKTAQENT